MELETLDSWHSLLRAVPVTLGLLMISQFLGSRLTLFAEPASELSQRSWPAWQFRNILGLNLLGLLALLCGGLSTRPAPAILLALAIVAAIWVFRKQRPSFASLIPKTWSWWHTSLTAALLFSLGPALTYPSGWDELTYHIELPRRWYADHFVSVQPDLPYSALPSMLEVLLTLTYPIESLITPRLLVWAAWLHGCFVFHDALKQLCQAWSARIVTLAISASPMALMISANCYVEAILWANVACILRLSVSPSPDVPWRRTLLIGTLIGGAIAIKMTSVGLLCLPVLWALLNSSGRSAWRSATLTLVTAVVFAAPFYFRTWYQTGNPIAPFYAAWFTDDAAWLECSRYHHDLAVGNFGLRGSVGLVAGPIALAFADEIYDGTLGWQWLLILVLLVRGVMQRQSTRPDCRVPRLSNWVLAHALAAILLYALWFVSSQQVRFAIPLLMISGMLASFAIESVPLSIRNACRWALLATTVISLPWSHAGYYLDSWLCVLKVRTPVDYVRDGVGDSYAELGMQLRESVPGQAKVVSLFEHRLAYLPASVEIATPYFQAKYFNQPDQQSAADFLAELKTRGVQYVILTTQPLGPDVSANMFERQQAWFDHVDQCIAKGDLQIIWKSEFHAIAKVRE